MGVLEAVIRKVLVTVTGEHVIDGVRQEPVITKAPGSCTREKDCLVLHYVQEPDENGIRTRSRVRIGDSFMEVAGTGAAASHMYFEEGVRHPFEYATPAGRIVLEAETTRFSLREEEDGNITAEACYTLYSGDARIQESRIMITAKEGDGSGTA